jgi:hypothetical protein
MQIIYFLVIFAAILLYLPILRLFGIPGSESGVHRNLLKYPHSHRFLKFYLCFDLLKVGFFMYFIQHCFICRPSDTTLSEDAGIERTQDCCELRHRQSDAITTRLDLIHGLICFCGCVQAGGWRAGGQPGSPAVRLPFQRPRGGRRRSRSSHPFSTRTLGPLSTRPTR